MGRRWRKSVCVRALRSTSIRLDFILISFVVQKCRDWGALSIRFHVVDGPRLVSSCVLHNDSICECT